MEDLSICPKISEFEAKAKAMHDAVQVGMEDLYTQSEKLLRMAQAVSAFKEDEKLKRILEIIKPTRTQRS